MQQESEAPLILGASLTGTAYIPSRTDVGRVLEASSGSAVTITVPTVADAGWRIGSIFQVFQQGAGQVTVVGDTGVTLRASGGKLKTAAQYSVLTLRMRANDEWVVSGDAST